MTILYSVSSKSAINGTDWHCYQRGHQTAQLYGFRSSYEPTDEYLGFPHRPN